MKFPSLPYKFRFKTHSVGFKLVGIWQHSSQSHSHCLRPCIATLNMEFKLICVWYEVLSLRFKFYFKSHSVGFKLVGIWQHNSQSHSISLRPCIATLNLGFKLIWVWHEVLSLHFRFPFKSRGAGFKLVGIWQHNSQSHYVFEALHWNAKHGVQTDLGLTWSSLSTL